MNDGGSAFPSKFRFYPGYSSGMSLRDYFAAMALQGMATADSWKDLEGHEKLVAGICYQLADGMLKERSKNG